MAAGVMTISSMTQYGDTALRCQVYSCLIADQYSYFGYSETILTRKELREKLEALRHSVGRLYWVIMNENPGCIPTCGTIKHTRHLSEVADVLERMIRTMIEQRKEYGF